MSTSQPRPLKSQSPLEWLLSLSLTDKLLLQLTCGMYAYFALKALRFMLLANKGLTDMEIIK